MHGISGWFAGVTIRTANDLAHSKFAASQCECAEAGPVIAAWTSFVRPNPRRASHFAGQDQQNFFRQAANIARALAVWDCSAGGLSAKRSQASGSASSNTHCPVGGRRVRFVRRVVLRLDFNALAVGTKWIEDAFAFVGDNSDVRDYNATSRRT